MNITTRQESNAFVVTPEGNLQHDTVCHLRDQLISLLHTHNAPSRIVINMEKVGTVDISGFGLLLAAHKSINAHGTLRICSVPKRVLKDMEAIRLDTRFAIFQDESSALI